MAIKTTIFHNPRCSKSRETLQLLHDNKCDIEVVEYLKTELSFNEIQTLIQQLGITPKQLIRTSESIFKELFKDKSLSDQQWIQAMVDYSVLIERPIVIHGNKAVIGRPPVLVLDIL